MHSKSKQVETYIELSSNIMLGDFLRAVRESPIEISDVQREQESDNDKGTRAYIATLKAKKRTSHQEILRIVQEIPGVVYLEEL